MNDKIKKTIAADAKQIDLLREKIASAKTPAERQRLSARLLDFVTGKKSTT